MSIYVKQTLFNCCQCIQVLVVYLFCFRLDIGKELSEQPKKNSTPPKTSNGNDICKSSLPNPLDMCRQPATLSDFHASPDFSPDFGDVDHSAVVLDTTVVNDINNVCPNYAKIQEPETSAFKEADILDTGLSDEVIEATVVNETNNLGTSHSSHVLHVSVVHGINTVVSGQTNHAPESTINEISREGTSHSGQMLDTTIDNETNDLCTSHSSYVVDDGTAVNETSHNGQFLYENVIDSDHLGQVVKATVVNETNNVGTNNMLKVLDTTLNNEIKNGVFSDKIEVPDVALVNETSNVSIDNCNQVLDVTVANEKKNIETCQTSQVLDATSVNETTGINASHELSSPKNCSNKNEMNKTMDKKADKKPKTHVPNPNGEVVLITTSVSDPNLSRCDSVNRDAKCSTYLRDNKSLREILGYSGGISTRGRSFKSASSLECYYKRGPPSLSRDSSPGSSGQPSPRIHRLKRQPMCSHDDEKSPHSHHEQFENFFNPSPKTSPGGRNRIYVPLSGSSSPQLARSPTLAQIPAPEDGQMSILSAVTSVGLSVMRFGEICAVTGYSPVVNKTCQWVVCVLFIAHGSIHQYFMFYLEISVRWPVLFCC